ncbi:hypothetical protein BH10PSE14_BH10PSE14_06280 [soil metagenome]
MGARIEKLTVQQVAALPGFRDHGLRAGLSTVPCDRPAAEKAMRAHYVALGRPEPRIIIWMDSPHQGVIAATLLSGAAISGAPVRAQVRAQVWDQVRDQVWDQVRAQVWDQVRDQVWDQVRAQVWAQVGDQVWAQVRAQVRDQVRAQVWAQVGDQVWDQVGDQVWDQVGDQVWAQVRAQVWAQVWDQVYRAGYGSMDMAWAAWAKAHAANGVALPAAGLTMIDVCETCGWWWPFENAVVITDRPKMIQRDTANRLHSMTGPALVYADGWSIHAVNGVRVPDWIVEQPHLITPEKIKGEKNAEIRRVMARVFGAHAGEDWLAAIGGRVIDEAPGDDARVGLRTGKLWRVEDSDGSYHYIDVLNSTPEPDGSVKRYQMLVNGSHYGGEAGTSLLAAWASTYRNPRNPAELAFAKPEHALFAVET